MLKPIEHMDKLIAEAWELPDEQRVTALLEVVRLYSPVILRMHEALMEAEQVAERIQQPRKRLVLMNKVLLVMQQAGYSRAEKYLTKVVKERQEQEQWSEQKPSSTL
jgi:cytochrome P450